MIYLVEDNILGSKCYALYEIIYLVDNEMHK